MNLKRLSAVYNIKSCLVAFALPIQRVLSIPYRSEAHAIVSRPKIDSSNYQWNGWLACHGIQIITCSETFAIWPRKLGLWRPLTVFTAVKVYGVQSSSYWWFLSAWVFRLGYVYLYVIINVSILFKVWVCQSNRLYLWSPQDMRHVTEPIFM